MSASIDPRFEDALRSLAARLDLPQPARSRTLLEIAGDLEDAYEHYRCQGLEENVALDAALDRFDLSDETVAELGALHSTWARRFMDSLSERGRSRFERGALALILLFVAALAWRRLSGAGLLDHVGLAALPSIALTLAGIAIAARKAWDLWLTGAHELRRLRRGLVEPLLAAVGGLLIGMAGFCIELYRMLSVLALPPLDGAASQAAFSATLLDGLRRAFATANTAMLGALLCCLLWWLLARKVTRIERAETEYLMQL